MTAIKQMLLVGLGRGWEAEYSSFISASKVGRKTVVKEESCSLGRAWHPENPQAKHTAAWRVNPELGSGRRDVDEMQHSGCSLESCPKDIS